MKTGDRSAFWRQFWTESRATGAVQPSSRYLAREMTARLRDATDRDSRLIVEMGPGTGAVTRAIAASMSPADSLDCYEINPRFAAHLREAVAHEPGYSSVRDRIEVHCRPAEEAPTATAVDFVICSVPLNNLEPELVQRIFDTGMSMLHGRGWFTFFEYPWLPELRRLTAPSSERRRLREVKDVKRRFRGDHAQSLVVLRNLPPARAVHVPAR